MTGIPKVLASLNQHLSQKSPSFRQLAVLVERHAGHGQVWLAAPQSPTSPQTRQQAVAHPPGVVFVAIEFII